MTAFMRFWRSAKVRLVLLVLLKLRECGVQAVFIPMFRGARHVAQLPHHAEEVADQLPAVVAGTLPLGAPRGLVVRHQVSHSRAQEAPESVLGLEGFDNRVIGFPVLLASAGAMILEPARHAASEVALLVLGDAGR